MKMNSCSHTSCFWVSGSICLWYLKNKDVKTILMWGTTFSYWSACECALTWSDGLSCSVMRERWPVNVTQADRPSWWIPLVASTRRKREIRTRWAHMHLHFPPLWARVRQQKACACVHLERFGGHAKLNHTRDPHTHRCTSRTTGLHTGASQLGCLHIPKTDRGIQAHYKYIPARPWPVGAQTYSRWWMAGRSKQQ